MTVVLASDNLGKSPEHRSNFTTEQADTRQRRTGRSAKWSKRDWSSSGLQDGVRTIARSREAAQVCWHIRYARYHDRGGAH